MNIPKNAKVIISTHALKRYLTRTEIMSEETYNHIERLANEGDKRAKKRLQDEKVKLEVRIRSSVLVRLFKDGCELRAETRSSKRSRSEFVMSRRGKEIVLITSYLQGRKSDFWKVKVEGGKANA